MHFTTIFIKDILSVSLVMSQLWLSAKLYELHRNRFTNWLYFIVIYRGQAEAQEARAPVNFNSILLFVLLTRSDSTREQLS